MNILMLEDNPADARLIQELLKDVGGAHYHFEQADRIAGGIQRLKSNSIDIVLLDLGLKDSQGLETLQYLSTHVSKVPIIVMTGLDDEVTAVRAMQQGAQDYLIKGQVEGATLWRSLRYAVERKRVQRQNELSLKVLETLNKPGEQREIVREILLLIKEFSGVEAAGMRLKEGNDYPYYESEGFVPGHVLTENYLCVRNDNGDPVLNSAGKPALAGICGKVIYGRFTPGRPCFTRAGSFWTNDIFELQTSHTGNHRPTYARNTCELEGYQSVALIPLKAEQGNIGLLQLCDKNRGHFTTDFIEFIEGVAQSIAAILARKKAEADLETSYISLQKSLRSTIDTVAKMVEMRDPYTSGHQHRVASLAKTIAAEMNLDESEVDHIWMAATIHDVGKMQVPVDILSRPGKLTTPEWEIIKAHPQNGYEILKEMKLPCTVAQTILQHHERLNGSGYPNALKQHEILLAAKILAVADVVEAMASHRPYRPSRGLDKALEEITINSGILYDPDIVKVCRSLFLEKGYTLE
jgi:putative nucleotidyltransferase with HDIG domain